MYMGNSFLQTAGIRRIRGRKTPIEKDFSQHSATLHGLGGVVLAKNNLPKPTINPNAVIKLQRK